MEGAYILSPLEETSRDPKENAGFVVTWSNSHQESRINSHSVQNDIGNSASPFEFLTRNLSKKGRSGSRVAHHNGDPTFAAFKVLSVDPARVRRSSSTGDGLYAEASDEMSLATTCKEAVDLIAESIERACKEEGGSVSVVECDVVG